MRFNLLGNPGLYIFRLVMLEFPCVSLAIGNFLFSRSGIGCFWVLPRSEYDLARYVQ